VSGSLPQLPSVAVDGWGGVDVGNWGVEVRGVGELGPEGVSASGRVTLNLGDYGQFTLGGSVGNREASSGDGGQYGVDPPVPIGGTTRCPDGATRLPGGECDEAGNGLSQFLPRRHVIQRKPPPEIQTSEATCWAASAASFLRMKQASIIDYFRAQDCLINTPQYTDGLPNYQEGVKGEHPLVNGNKQQVYEKLGTRWIPYSSEQLKARIANDEFVLLQTDFRTSEVILSHIVVVYGYGVGDAKPASPTRPTYNDEAISYWDPHHNNHGYFNDTPAQMKEKGHGELASIGVAAKAPSLAGTADCAVYCYPNSRCCPKACTPKFNHCTLPDGKTCNMNEWRNRVLNNEYCRSNFGK
jgi:hypothetical protein